MRKWLEDEIQELKIKFKEELSDKEISKLLNRTEGSIKQKRCQLRLFHPFSSIRWLEDEIQELKIKFKEELSDKEISKLLNRTEGSIKQKRCQLRFLQPFSSFRHTNWSENEIMTLKIGFEEEVSDTEIAKVIGRTEKSIKKKRYQLRLFCPPKYKRWLKNEIQSLKIGFEKGLTDKKISEMIGRTEGSIKQKRHQLRLLRVTGRKTHLSHRERAFKNIVKRQIESGFLKVNNRG